MESGSEESNLGSYNNRLAIRRENHRKKPPLPGMPGTCP